RQETIRLTKASEFWDGRVCELVVTNTTMEGVELRVLISAASSPRAWDLRCHLREKLVEFIQKNYPEALPRTRAELQSMPEAPSPSGPAG
ncbi:MAG: mechanosensitive ion channel family protein, partial [Alphaproteobacteria bacterium]|nr:mechanosensitive ion channel family protein [Alphaproteobacteria bacterium]